MTRETFTEYLQRLFISSGPGDQELVNLARADFAGMIVWYSRRLADLDQTVVKSKRLHEVEALYRAALERGPAERRAFLEEACAGDEELRREVQSLLAYDERAERWPAGDRGRGAGRSGRFRGGSVAGPCRARPSPPRSPRWRTRSRPTRVGRVARR